MILVSYALNFIITVSLIIYPTCYLHRLIPSINAQITQFYLIIKLLTTSLIRTV